MIEGSSDPSTDNRKHRDRRGIVITGGLAAIVLALSLTMVPVAFNSNPKSGLSAYADVTIREPLPACVGNGDCTATNHVWSLIHVINSNDLPNWLDGPPEFSSRDSLENAFVLTSIDSAILINGVAHHEFDATFTPPPNLTDFFRSAGRWPSTVTCGQPIQVPCTVVGGAAVIPGENVIAFYSGWTHTVDEPGGKYVFKFTIHGTLNGEPLTLTATSPQITMTG